MPSASQNPPNGSASRSHTTMSARDAISAKAAIRIGVDLTPILPGFGNEGAKSATLEFIKTLLSDFADQFSLTLFVPAVANEELQAYFSEQADLNCTYIGPPSTNSLVLEALANHCIISQPSAFFRRSVIEKYGPLAKAHKYCVDYEFWMRLQDLVEWMLRLESLDDFYLERSSLVLAQARTFDWNVTAGKVLELYRQVL